MLILCSEIFEKLPRIDQSYENFIAFGIDVLDPLLSLHMYIFIPKDLL